MALRSILRKNPMNPPSRYKAWLKMLTDKAKTPEDHLSVSALSAVCDYYALSPTSEELRSKNNFEVKWDEWSHLQTEGLVSKLKAKIEAINSEPYETEVLSHEVVSVTEQLKRLGHIVAYNATLHATHVSEKDNLIENIYHARPFESLDFYEVRQMYKYRDLPSRWDKELGWFMGNNDQIIDDYVTANSLQFQKDMHKFATNMYYYDYLGKHQVMCTAGKLSQTFKEH
jgi:hypothetical protein